MRVLVFEMVEAPGVEPGSGNTPPQTSTYLVLFGCLSRLNPSRTRGFWRYPVKVSPRGYRHTARLFHV